MILKYHNISEVIWGYFTLRNFLIGQVKIHWVAGGSIVLRSSYTFGSQISLAIVFCNVLHWSTPLNKPQRMPDSWSQSVSQSFSHSCLFGAFAISSLNKFLASVAPKFKLGSSGRIEESHEKGNRSMILSVLSWSLVRISISYVQFNMFYMTYHMGCIYVSPHIIG